MSCGKLLAKIGNFTEIAIKCPRCKSINFMKARAPLDVSAIEHQTVANAKPTRED